MGRPRQEKVNTRWSPNLAYVAGVIASDGNISPSLRHISFTSKDREMLENIKDILGIQNKIGTKARGGEKVKKYFVLQFGDVHFVEFLDSIGLKPNKSKTIEHVSVPDKYFPDFLRGVIDGDGCIDIFYHPESKHPQVRIRIAGASKLFLEFLLNKAQQLCAIDKGFILSKKSSRVYVLTFSKADTLQLLPKLYYATNLPCLSRKRDIAAQALKGNT
jgi:hypothetical protein